MDFFNYIFHNLALLEFYFLNIIYILLYIDFILSIFFQHSNILTRASHHWCLASNIVLVELWCGRLSLEIHSNDACLSASHLKQIHRPGPGLPLWWLCLCETYSDSKKSVLIEIITCRFMHITYNGMLTQLFSQAGLQLTCKSWDDAILSASPSL